MGVLQVDAPESEWPKIEAAALLVTIADLRRPKAEKMLRRAWGEEIAKICLGFGSQFVVVKQGRSGA